MNSSVLFIDNRDSFTYNIIEYLHRLHVPYISIKDSICTQDVDEWKELIQPFSHLILGPGPGAPDDFPHIIELIPQLENRIPVLGICLGHQMIIKAYGGDVKPTGFPIHGKTSPIFYSQACQLFNSMPNPFLAGRYHSLGAYETPDALYAVAHLKHEMTSYITSPIMAVEHKTAPIFGVQFHPESFLSEHGLTLLSNFLNLSQLR